MTHEDIIEFAEKVDISKCMELIPDRAYLYVGLDVLQPNWKIWREFIVLLHDGEVAGGILRMEYNDVHWVIRENLRGNGILSNFLRTGLLQTLWRENKRAEVQGAHIIGEDAHKRNVYLVELAGMTVLHQSLGASVSLNYEKGDEERLLAPWMQECQKRYEQWQRQYSR